MASGWAPDGAVQDQIDDTVMDGVLRARASMPTGEGETNCLECGDAIIPVTLPRPRGLELLTQPAFNALKREVFELIRGH